MCLLLNPPLYQQTYPTLEWDWYTAVTKTTTALAFGPGRVYPVSASKLRRIRARVLPPPHPSGILDKRPGWKGRSGMALIANANEQHPHSLKIKQTMYLYRVRFCVPQSRRSRSWAGVLEEWVVLVL